MICLAGPVHVGIMRVVAALPVRLARMRSVLRNRRLGDMLVASGALTDRQLRELLDLQASREAAWVRLGDLALEEGYITSSELAAALSLPESRQPQVVAVS